MTPQRPARPALLLLATSALIAACSGPAEPPSADAAEPAPEAAVAEAAVEQAAGDTAAPATPDVAMPAEAPQPDEGAEAYAADDPDATAGHDDHDDHADHAGEEDHAAHDEHDEAGHGGGERHVHGEADAAIALDGNTLTVSFQTALASFGLSEEEPAGAEARAALDAALAPFESAAALVTLPAAAECEPVSADTSTEYTDGGRGNFIADYAFTCGAPDAIDSVTFPVFAAFPSLETIEAVWLVGADQASNTLTPDNPVIAP